MAQTSSGFSPAAVPGFSVVPPEGQQIAQAMEAGPERAATQDAATEQAKAAKAQAALGEQNANDQLLQRIVAPALTNPAVAQSPQWQKLVSDKLGASGMQLPKGADGNIDVQALQGMVAPTIKQDISPEGALKAAQVPAGPARDMLLSLYNPASVSAEMKNGPMVPSQETINTSQKAFNQQLLATQEGKVSPSAFMAGVNKDMLPYFGQSWANINHDPALLGGMTALAKANLDKMVAAGLLSRASANLKVAEMEKQPSIEALNLAHAKYFGQAGAILGQREQIAYMNAQTNQQRAGAYIADVNQRINDAHNGSWSARQQLQQKDLQQLLTQRRDAQVDVRQAYAMLERAKANGDDYTTPLADGQPSLLDSLTSAQRSLKAYDQTIESVKNPSLAANAARGQLNAIGGAGVTNKPQNADGSGAKTVVKTGTRADGTRVVQYSDGTIGPAP